MTIPPMMTLAGVAAGGLATLAAQSVDSGLDFLSELNKQQAEPSAAAGPSRNVAGQTPPTISLGDIKKSAQEALDRFHKLLGTKLSELGVDLSQSFTLAIDGLGGIQETSGHPQAKEIEQLLATDMELSNLFRQSASQFELARAGEEQTRFAQIYEKNPDLALQQFSHLFDDKYEPPSYAVQFSGTAAEVLFQ